MELQSDLAAIVAHAARPASVSLRVLNAKEDRAWALALVEANVRDVYERSNDGWKRREKQKQLALPHMHLLGAFVGEDRAGFVAFRVEEEPTMADDDSVDIVLYCYELHVDNSFRGRGLGQLMMRVLDDIAATISGCRFIMLTTFKHNPQATGFYMHKLGFSEDERSPGRVLPRDEAAAYDYLILSKPVCEKQPSANNNDNVLRNR